MFQVSYFIALALVIVFVGKTLYEFDFGRMHEQTNREQTEVRRQPEESEDKLSTEARTDEGHWQEDTTSNQDQPGQLPRPGIGEQEERQEEQYEEEKAHNAFCVAIGGGSDDQGSSIIQTSDGGYVIAGSTWSYGEGNYDVYVIKLDRSGNLQWTRTIGGEQDDHGNAIIQTSDGGYAIAGYTRSFGQGSSDVYVVKLDDSGNLEWTKTIGGADWDEGNAIVQTSDGGYLITGFTESFGELYADIYVVKLDGSGNLEWTKTISGASDEWGYSIIQTSDAGYAIVGVLSSGGGEWDVYVVKLDGAGDLQWAKAIGGTQDDYGYAIIQTTDGGYAIVGDTKSFKHWDRDVYVIKLDGSGNLEWTRIIGGVDEDGGKSILQTSDGGYVIVGYTESFGQEERNDGDVYVIKLDGSGNLEWTRAIGGSDWDEGISVVQTSDGGYAIAGFTESFGQGGRDVYVVKLDEFGNLVSCPGGCAVDSGGEVGSGGIVATVEGEVSWGGKVSSGGYVSSGGVLTRICPEGGNMAKGHHKNWHEEGTLAEKPRRVSSALRRGTVSAKPVAQSGLSYGLKYSGMCASRL